MRREGLLTATAMIVIGLAGCGANPPGDNTTCDPTASDCIEEGLVCASFADGVSRCATPVQILGHVLDLADDTPIAGALVQAVDANGTPVGTTGETDEQGAYVITVPALRDTDGIPIEGTYTLRVQAAGYQHFPTAIRPALPIDVSTAALGEDVWVIENALTTVKLIALPGDTSLLGSISGVILAEKYAGILVVAEGTGGALTGFSDVDGNYVVFNVPAGTYTVSGYAADVQITPRTTSVTQSEAVTGVDLSASSKPLSTVTGNVQIVNAPGGSQTSVVLAVEGTFEEAAGRGSVPPGLRVGGVTGAFTISGVPDGNYVVLAAFENDFLVRDPDQTIGGTTIVRIEVPDPEAGNTITLPEGFKVTEALRVVSPGSDDPELVDSLTPVFEWEDDSSEDGYEITVLDAFGNLIWTDEIGPVSGSATVQHTYAGPALEAGMFYQFRTTSFRENTGTRTAISTTEDLKGVFYYLEP
jgi:hypothetical protein